MSDIRKDDSSDDEKDFTSNIRLPNLEAYKRHKKKKSNTNHNLVKAGKKFTQAINLQQKPHQRVHSPRQSYISADSSNNEIASSSSSDSDDEINDLQEGSSRGRELPNFTFQNPQNETENYEVGSDDDDEVYEHDQGLDEELNLPDQIEDTDSDDDDNNNNNNNSNNQPLVDPNAVDHETAPEDVPIQLGKEPDLYVSTSRDSHASKFSHFSLHSLHSHQSRQSKPDLHRELSKSSSLRHNIFRRPSMFSSNSKQLHHGETDITDQLGTTASATSGGSGRSAGVFKDILRKMALQDAAYPERNSHSDTFIGQMLSNDGDMSLSGGGMAPGAARFSRERTIDEEEEIGSEDNSFADRDSIELQKLDFAQLNNEARNLINVHVPERYRQPTLEDNVQSNASGDTMKDKEDSGNENSNEKVRTSSDTIKTDKYNELYAPNPDLYLRSDVQYDDNGEFMMLDDDSGLEIAPPTKVHAGVLSSLLKLYQNPDESKSSSSLTYGDHSTLNDFDYSEPTKTSSSLDFSKIGGDIKGGLKHSGKFVKDSIPFMKKNKSSLHIPTVDEFEEGEDGEDFKVDENGMPSFQNAKPKQHRKAMVNPANMPSTVSKKIRKAKKKAEEQLKITVHIADVLQRQRFIMLMCKALMLFGAPTHRLEEYMVMTSRVLEIDGQFIYIPGCMIMAFGDAATRTSEVHLVKCSQGVNLSKLNETHKIYKSVIHDLMGAEEASVKLTKILRLKNLYNPWFCVFFYGLGSSMVCPFAFGGGWTDIPISFGVGLCVGYLQFFVSSMSNLYSSVFEVSASIVVAFIARAIGSINGGKTFCFSAITQGSLALILPGYIILCGSLELQSRNLVAGSVRMFYAIIYSLFLGFGITLGAALYGWVDKDSVSDVTCPAAHQLDPKFRILFVPAFAACLGLINQAALIQLPVMLIIAGISYVGTYFAGLHFQNVSEFTACIGAFIVGVLGNLYSRIWKGMAVSAMLPAIFVQVPSGIASQSSLLSGITTANQITQDNQTTTTTDNGTSLSFGSAMVEVAIGISVGLFGAALIVYPFGKKKTGLFSL